MHRLPRWLKALLIGSLGLYLLIGALLYSFQRHMVFVPFPGPTTPEAAGLQGFTRQFFTASDGAQIPYWISTPQNPLPQRGRGQGEGESTDATQQSARVSTPLLFYFHGNGGGLHAFTFALPHLQKQGYTVIAMEYRGYPGAPGTPSEKAIVADAIALTQSLRKTHPTQPTVLWGYSLGSGVATQVAAHIEGESALVLEAPFTSVADRAAELWPLYPVRHLIKDPFLSINHIGKVGTPLFIMHGEQDWIVPARHSARLFAAANQPKQRTTYPAANHFTLVEHGAYNDAFSFIETHTTR